MAESRFTYVTYIRTTQEALWDALTRPEFTRSYWCECWHDTTWQKGATWDLVIPDGRVCEAGSILDVIKPERLVLKWRNEFQPMLRAEGYSRCSFALTNVGEQVKLSLTHSIDVPDSKLIAAFSAVWPLLFSSLKSLLETGAALEETRLWPRGV